MDNENIWGILTSVYVYVYAVHNKITLFECL